MIKTVGELDYDPYYAQKDKESECACKNRRGNRAQEQFGEQKRKSADGGAQKIATSAVQSIETKRTTATEVRANWHLAAVRRMRQTLTKSERNKRESGCSR